MNQQRQVEVLAIIPARGGSKSLPRKNIRLLGGLPLIVYSMAAAIQSKLVTRVIVSTDDPEIARISLSKGAEVPFIRPSELAQDDTLDLPVFQHALTWLKENEGYLPNIVVQLRPTSPFRLPGLVDQAVSLLLKDSQADSVRSVTPSGQNPYKMWRFDKESYMLPLLKVPGIDEPYNSPRQKLPDTHWQTGHIDVIRYKTIMNQSSMSGKKILPVIIDPLYAVDIDKEFDLVRAEWLMKHFKLPIVKP